MHSIRSLKSRQRGLTMIGFLFVAAVLVMLAMLAMKVLPAYVEYFAVKKILSTMGQQSDLRSMSNGEIRSAFAKRASVDDVTLVKPEDITVDRRGGVPVLSADYSFRTELARNISLVIDFSASSDPRAAPVDVE